MRSWRILIHPSLVYLSSLHALFDKLQQLLFRLDIQLRQSIDKDASLWILSDLKAIFILAVDPRYRRYLATNLGARIPHLGNWGAWLLSLNSCLAPVVPESRSWSILFEICVLVQQICDLLHVDLQKWDCHSKRAFDRILFDVFKDMVHTPRN